MRFNRRQFLQATSVASIAADLVAAPAIQIIDAHTHFYDTSRPGGTPWPAKTDTLLYRPVLPAEYRRLTRKLGIVGTIEVEASPLLEDNQWVLDLAVKDPIIVGTVGHLEPGKPDFRSNLERFARNPHFRGIRIGTLWGQDVKTELPSPQFAADMRAIAAAGLEVDIVGDGDYILPAVLVLNDRIPDLRIVIDHLPFNQPKESTMLRELETRTNIFAKISNVPRNINGTVPKQLRFYKLILDQVFTVFGPNRVLYGSNWPVSERIAPFEVALNIVRQYFEAKGADVARKYFHDNAVKVYGLKAL